MAITTTSAASLTESDLRGYDDISFTESLFNYKVTYSPGVANEGSSLFIECTHREDGDRWSHTMTSQNCDEDLEEQDVLTSPRGTNTSYARLLPLSPKYLYKILNAHKNGEIDTSISIIFPNKIKDVRSPIYIEISIKLPHFDDHDILRRIKLQAIHSTDIDRVQYRFGHLQKKIQDEILEMKQLSQDMNSKMCSLDKTPEIFSLRSDVTHINDLVTNLADAVNGLLKSVGRLEITITNNVVSYDQKLLAIQTSLTELQESGQKTAADVQQLRQDTDAKLATCQKRHCKTLAAEAAAVVTSAPKS